MFQRSIGNVDFFAGVFGPIQAFGICHRTSNRVQLLLIRNFDLLSGLLRSFQTVGIRHYALDRIMLRR